jgi:RND family efflux transporter MFP subunit
LVAALPGAFPVPAVAAFAGAEGVTEAVVDVTLSLAVPGIVSVVHFKEGDSVRSNDVILELEHTIADLDCHRLKLVMENRKQDAEATRTVYEKSKSLSKEELDKKELEYRVAEADHEIAREQVALRQLRAPSEGVLVDLPLDPGEASEAYQPLARLVNPRAGQFICNLDHHLASRFKLGQQVELELDTSGGRTRVKGEVVFLSPVVDQASSLREVKVRFANDDGRVSLGVPGRLVLE